MRTRWGIRVPNNIEEILVDKSAATMTVQPRAAKIVGMEDAREPRRNIEGQDVGGYKRFAARGEWSRAEIMEYVNT